MQIIDNLKNLNNLLGVDPKAEYAQGRGCEWRRRHSQSSSSRHYAGSWNGRGTVGSNDYGYIGQMGAAQS